MYSRNPSKFYPPSTEHTLPRDRLLKRLQDNQDKNQWWIIGQGAQGKTTFIASWVYRSRLGTVWLDIDPNDSPLENFFLSLVQSLSLCLGRDLTDLVEEAGLGKQPGAPKAKLRYLARMVYGHLPVDFQLVLDGLDRLRPGAPAMMMVDALLEGLPLDRRLILLSRQNPANLAELTLKSNSLIINNQEMAYTEQEVSQLAELLTGVDLNPSEVAGICRLTEGWVGGVTLCIEALRAMPPQRRGQWFHNQVPGKVTQDLFQYFGSHVFERLPPGTQNFLMRYAQFQGPNSEIVPELTQEPDAQGILREFANKHLFVSSVQSAQRGTVFRLHHLFKSFLNQAYEQRTTARERRDFLARSAPILAAAEHTEEAIECYLLCGETAAAARLIKRAAPDLLRDQRANDLAAWLDQLDPALLQEDPWLRYFLCANRSLFEAHRNLQDLPEVLRGFQRAGDDRGLLLAYACSIDSAMLAGGSWSEFEQLMQRADEALARQDPQRHLRERAVLLIQMARIHSVRGKPIRAHWACQQAYLLARRLNDPHLLCRVLLFHLDSLNFMGEISQAQKKDAELDALLGQMTIPMESEEVYIAKCYLYLLRGDFAKARAILDRAQDLVAERGLTYFFPVVLIYEVLYAVWINDHHRMAQAVEQIHTQPTGVINPFIVAACGCAQAISRLRNRDYRGAMQLIEPIEQLFRSDEAKSLTHWATSALVKAKAARELGREPRDLVGQLTSLSQTLLDMGSYHMLTECELLLALLYLDLEDPVAARQNLARAVQRAKEKEYRVFPIIWFSHLDQLLPAALRLESAEAMEFFMAMLLVESEPEFANSLERLQNHAEAKVRDLAWELERLQRQSRLPMLDIKCLNGFEARLGEEIIVPARWERKQARHLLMAIVALGPGEVSKSQLVQALWPAAKSESADKNFRVTLHRLRRALEPDLDRKLGSSYVLSQNGRLQLNPAICTSDLAEFRRLQRQAGEREAAGENAAALQSLEQAAGLYGAGFLAGEPGDWAEEARQALQQEYGNLLMHLARLQERWGSVGRAMDTLGRLIRDDPLCEPAYQRLMILQAEVGLFGEAARTYEACREQLKQGLDAEPGWATKAAYQEIVATRGEDS